MNLFLLPPKRYFCLTFSLFLADFDKAHLNYKFGAESSVRGHQSTPTHMIVACFYALRIEPPFPEKITPMPADHAPTRTNTTASTTRLAE